MHALAFPGALVGALILGPLVFIRGMTALGIAPQGSPVAAAPARPTRHRET